MLILYDIGSVRNLSETRHINPHCRHPKKTKNGHIHTNFPLLLQYLWRILDLRPLQLGKATNICIYNFLSVIIEDSKNDNVLILLHQLLGAARVYLQWFNLEFRHRMTVNTRHHLQIKFNSKFSSEQHRFMLTRAAGLFSWNSALKITYLFLIQ